MLMEHLVLFSSPASLPWPTYTYFLSSGGEFIIFYHFLVFYVSIFFSPNTLEDLSDSYQHFFQLCIEMKWSIDPIPLL